jgi:hypothetical protein
MDSLVIEEWSFVAAHHIFDRQSGDPQPLMPCHTAKCRRGGSLSRRVQ